MDFRQKEKWALKYFTPDLKEDIDNQALFARNLLDEAQEIPLEIKNLDAFQTYCQESENLLTSNGIMDLRLSSEFVLSYTDECDYNELLKDRTQTQGSSATPNQPNQLNLT